MATLVLELMLTRVFDVVLAPNISYFVVTAAVFAFGLAGIYATLRPVRVDADIRGSLVGCSVAFALTTLLQIPIINALPLDYMVLGHHPFSVGGSFLLLYLTLLTPLFLGGYVLIGAFSKYTANILGLYF